MTERTAFQPGSNDEKLLAAAAHAAILIPGIGFVAPLVIWMTQRGKSAYTTYQSLQALGYQLLFMLFYWLVSIIGVVLWIGAIIVGSVFAASLGSGEGVVLIIFGTEFLFFFFLLGMAGLYVLGGLLAGILCLTGKAFRYPLLGPWLEKYLTWKPAEPVEVANA
jgi:uncharacterized Tic20 family protein